jgi:broad specificity phosphatase PhoE
MTLLAMLRHGETEWSREGRIQGRTDVPLSDAGRRRMAAFKIPVACRDMRVVTSPLRRCVETAVALGLGSVDVESRIAEMSWGDWEGERLAELRERLGTAMQANEARGFDFAPPGGESPRQVLGRVQSWLAEVASSGKPTLAIAHRGVIRVIFASASEWDMLGRPPAKLDWEALHCFRLDAAGRPTVSRLNVPLEPMPPVRT